MNTQLRYYAPDEQTTPGGGTNSQRSDETNDHSELADVSGPIRDSDEDDSGVSRRNENAGTLTGTDKDETGPDENMATES